MLERATPITRWQQFYSDDPGIGAIQPSQCVQRAVGQFRQQRASVVLDLGCGAGRNTAVLAQHMPAVIGVDAAMSGLALAGQQAMLLATAGAFSCTKLATLPDVGCTGSAHYTVHVGVFLKV